MNQPPKPDAREQRPRWMEIRKLLFLYLIAAFISIGGHASYENTSPVWFHFLPVLSSPHVSPLVSTSPNFFLS